MDENADQYFSEPLPPEDRKKNGVAPIVPPFVWLIAIFLVGILLGNILWLLAADVLAFGREDLEVEFIISDSDSFKDISKNLKAQGLVKYAWLFRLYARITNSDSKLKPGTYTLSSRYDYHALVKVLSAGKVQQSLSFNPKTQGVIEIKWLNWNY